MHNNSSQLVPHGNKRVAEICGRRWPRVLSVTAAAAYAYLPSAAEFEKIPEFAVLIHTINGRRQVDLNALDQVIDHMFEEHRS